jgi:hypothetical protein
MGKESSKKDLFCMVQRYGSSLLALPSGSNLRSCARANTTYIYCDLPIILLNTTRKPTPNITILSTSIKMLSSSILLATLAFLAPVKAAVYIPIGSPDGVYTHTTTPDGNTTLEYLGPHGLRDPEIIPYDSEALPAARATRLAARAGQGSNCQEYLGRSSDFTAVGLNLGSKCGTAGFKFDKSVSVLLGGVVAYGCNYGNGQTCKQTDVNYFFARITSKCGDNRAGWWSEPDWKASYGRTFQGIGYC